MCFTNLPVEFDDEGNPYLAEDAEDVDPPDCGCGVDVALDEDDPHEAYDAILESVPADVLRHLEDSPETTTADDKEATSD